MRVVIIDDEKAMHIILKHMLAKIEHVEVVESFQETASAFSFLEQNEVDMAFVDISLPNESGLDFAKRLRKINMEIKLVFITSHKEYALSAFSVYAYDYIVKPISQSRLLETVERSLSEWKATNDGLTDADEEESFPELIEPLTKREEEIIQLIGEGLTNKQIAKSVHLSEGTIKNHLVTIFGKLQVKNRVQATLVAKKHKLIE